MRIMRSCLAVLVALAICGAARASNIIWVSDGDELINPGTKNDQGFVDLLTSAGHTVTRMDHSAGGANSLRGPLSDAEKAMLNAADLIVFSRDTNSSEYNAPASDWNGLTAPLLLLNPYAARPSKWRWLDGSEGVLPNALVPLFAFDPGDDVFANVWLGESQQVDVITSSTSFVDTPGVGNGTLVARRADNDWVWIARWSAKVQFYDGAWEVAGGERMYFSAGANGPTGYAGEYNLTADGQTMFLNAVRSIAVPEPSTILLLGVGAAGLLASAGRKRRRR